MMTERDQDQSTTEEQRHEGRRVSQEERDRAAAVHSVDDETRMHADADETELVQGAGGELRRVDDGDGDANPVDAEHDDQDSEPTKNAPDEVRPDVTAASENRDDGS